MKSERQVKLVGVLILSAIVIGSLALSGRAQKAGELRQFMRQKLEHSQRVLEGLTREDFPLVARNARAMKGLSQDAQWRVSQNLNYVRLSDEFQGLTEELAQKARDENLDGATLAYLKVTLKCVECHKLVRDERLISQASP